MFNHYDGRASPPKLWFLGPQTLILEKRPPPPLIKVESFFKRILTYLPYNGSFVFWFNIHYDKYFLVCIMFLPLDVPMEVSHWNAIISAANVFFTKFICLYFLLVPTQSLDGWHVFFQFAKRFVSSIKQISLWDLYIGR